jgi:calcineurin-like phosphoesterase family protein
MKLYAISDLHVGFRENRRALLTLSGKVDGWLIVAGDVAEDEDAVCGALELLRERYARVIWVPGNHELWSTGEGAPRGAWKYLRLVERCRALGVITPEDPYPIWTGEGGPHRIAPMFLLYDYSFAEDGVAPADAVRGAREAGTVCADERFLFPDPFASREEWCAHRCGLTEARLEACAVERPLPLVMVNHYPLKRQLAHLPLCPAFKIWCGTRRTEDWATRFGASVAVSGHLHIRSTRRLEGTRYEEVSLGYPHRQWDPARGIEAYIRQILP